jgi:hypothetical protein
MIITYAITAKDEASELERLLSHLKKHIRETDEVIIQLDINHTPEVLEVCNLYTGFNHEQDLHNTIKNSQFYVFALDGNFAQFKNQLSRFASGDYIFQIDADEIPETILIHNLPELLESNPTVDLFLVPRINTVEGLTEEHIKKWEWKVNEYGWINFPDYQTRLYKNSKDIRWEGKVHERIEGVKTFVALPENNEWVLIHEKDIKRQEKQNNFYNTL